MKDKLEVLDLKAVSESQLPSIISTQFDNLAELENNIQKAVELAENAREMAEDAQVSAGLGKKKYAIELLQDATQGLAEAQISATDAQKLLFEYQTKLTEITKFLFGLGVSNLAMNRSVVRELELKLKGASEEDISALAKQELRNVILQLKAQEDMMKKQELLTGKVKEQAGQIKNIGKQLEIKDEVDDEQNEKIAENAKNLTRHDEVLSAHQQKDEEHDKKFRAKDILDENQDKKILENAEKIKMIEEDMDEFSRSFEVEIAKIKSDINDTDRAVSAKVDTLSERIGAQAYATEEQISIIKEFFGENLKEASSDLHKDIEELKSEISSRNTEIDCRLEELSKRIGDLETVTSKKAWKIIVSVVAVGSLLLNILQILGVF